MSVRDDIENLVTECVSLSDQAKAAEGIAQRALDAFENEEYAAARSILDDFPDALRGPMWPEDLITVSRQAQGEIEENAGV